MTLEDKIKALREDLLKDAQRSLAGGRLNYYVINACIIWTITLTGLAGVGGLLFEFEAETVSATAILSGLGVAVATALKLQQRADMYYDRHDRLKGLVSFLDFEMPDPPTNLDLAAVSKLGTDARMETSRLWIAKASLTQSDFEAAKAAAVHDTRKTNAQNTR